MKKHFILERTHKCSYEGGNKQILMDTMARYIVLARAENVFLEYLTPTTTLLPSQQKNLQGNNAMQITWISGSCSEFLVCPEGNSHFQEISFHFWGVCANLIMDEKQAWNHNIQWPAIHKTGNVKRHPPKQPCSPIQILQCPNDCDVRSTSNKADKM